MSSYDVAWNVMCYVAAIAVLLCFVLYMMAEIRAGKERQQKASPFNRARSMINGLAEDSRLHHDSPKRVDASEALEFVKGYVRALDDNLLISEAESVAIRNELKRWPETLLAE
ncbi:hypothetical protein HF209_30555 [Pseudomonas sp. WS 5096]|uniref:Uncharacterized protein n=1 Tax=Pseudomonas cremoris TaxID=2724178 RepID=A0ABR6TH39_9PSED|nr:hypothetical protein [Pseudomonas cremoris]MBC2385299.1 hypothetical protein [Pseudomonas cremoris]